MTQSGASSSLVGSDPANNSASILWRGTGATGGSFKTKEALLDAATAVMIEKDTIDFALTEISARTGLSAALVQYHFGSKDGMMMAIVERGMVKAVEQLNWLREADMPAKQKLRMHLQGLVASYAKSPFINRLVHALMRGATDDRARQIGKIFIAPIAQFHRDLLAQGVNEDVFEPIDPMHFYVMIVGACEQLVARSSAMRHVFDIDAIDGEVGKAFAKTLFEIVWGGIAKQPRLTSD